MAGMSSVGLSDRVDIFHLETWEDRVGQAALAVRVAHDSHVYPYLLLGQSPLPCRARMVSQGTPVILAIHPYPKDQHYPAFQQGQWVP